MTFNPSERPKWVVFDTETSGLFSKGAADDPGQPRMASLAMIWTTPGFTVVRKEVLYIKPDGWVMDPGATAHNKLTDEFLMERGRPVAEALDLYESAIDDGYAFAAFNSQFDTKVLRAELRRAGRPDRFEETYNTCVMRKNIGICKLRKAGNKGAKMPTLAQALAHWKIEQYGAHTAMGDAWSALQLLKALDSIGIDITPEIYGLRSTVHGAKSKPKTGTNNGPEKTTPVGEFDFEAKTD
jgi:DNA polymerase III subunit epsilon